MPNCHLKLRGKAIDILPLGARLKKYGHLNHPHISTTNHLGHDNNVALNFCSVDSGFLAGSFSQIQVVVGQVGLNLIQLLRN